MPITTTPRGVKSPSDRSQAQDGFAHAGRQIAAILNALLQKQALLDSALDKQRQALIQGKLEAIEESNAEVDAVMADIERIDLERDSLAMRIARIARGETEPQRVNPWSLEAEFAPSTVKLDDLLECFPNEVCDSIEESRQRLKAMIPVTRHKLRINHALAQNGSKIVHATLGIMTTIIGREGPDKHQTYGSKGTTQYGRTQVRSLLNRRA